MARRAKRGFDIIEFTTDKHLLNLQLSPAQEVLLRSAYALPLTQEQRAIFTQCTGRDRYTPRNYPEITVVAGARSGKDSRIAGPVVCYEAFFGGHAERLHKGEKAVIALVAQDKDAAGVAFSYIKSYIMESQYLRAEVVAEPLTNEIQLKSGIRIVTFPSSLKSLRAYSFCAAVLDEVAFFRLEGGANSDVEIQASVRRGMINFTNTKLVKISTPWMKDGLLFQDFERAYGQDDPDLLVWRASTALMNPSLDPKRLARERRMDTKRFAREFEAIFQDDLEAFIPEQLLERAIVPGRSALPPVPGRFYIGAVDASGGGSCAFAICVVETELDSTEPERSRVVETVIRAWERSKTEPLDLEGATREASECFRSYGISEVWSDKYSAGWSRQAFGRHGIRLVDAPSKSECYLELEPLFTASRIKLLDDPIQNRELGVLERRNRPGGKPEIGPPRSGRDDRANALALAAQGAVLNLSLPPADAYQIPVQERYQLEREFGYLGENGLVHFTLDDDLR